MKFPASFLMAEGEHAVAGLDHAKEKP